MGKYPARNKPIQTLQTARNRIFSSQYAAEHILWRLIAETSHATGRQLRIAGKSQIKQLQPDKSQYLCLYVLKKCMHVTAYVFRVQNRTKPQHHLEILEWRCEWCW